MSHPVMRAKMRVHSLAQYDTCEVLKLSAVSASNYPADGSDENNTFARWTPTATMEMTITNPDLRGKFAPGEEYYLDFTRA